MIRDYDRVGLGRIVVSNPGWGYHSSVTYELLDLNDSDTGLVFSLSLDEIATYLTKGKFDDMQSAVIDILKKIDSEDSDTEQLIEEMELK